MCLLEWRNNVCLVERLVRDLGCTPTLTDGAEVFVMAIGGAALSYLTLTRTPWWSSSCTCYTNTRGHTEVELLCRQSGCGMMSNDGSSEPRFWMAPNLLCFKSSHIKWNELMKWKNEIPRLYKFSITESLKVIKHTSSVGQGMEYLFNLKCMFIEYVALRSGLYLGSSRGW